MGGGIVMLNSGRMEENDKEWREKKGEKEKEKEKEREREREREKEWKTPAATHVQIYPRTVSTFYTFRSPAKNPFKESPVAFTRI